MKAQDDAVVGAITHWLAVETGSTRSTALDYAAQGIRVSALAPGPSHTEQFDRGPAAQTLAVASVPMRRLALADEIAAAAGWLCGPDAAFVTGTTVTIDGGLLRGMAPYSAPAEFDREEP